MPDFHKKVKFSTNFFIYMGQFVVFLCTDKSGSIQLSALTWGDDRPVSCRNAICQNCLFYNARPDPDNWCSQDKRSKWAYSECWYTRARWDRISAASFFCTKNKKRREKANKNNFILHIKCMETNMLFRVSKSAVGTRYRNHSAKTMYESLEN